MQAYLEVPVMLVAFIKRKLVTFVIIEFTVLDTLNRLPSNTVRPSENTDSEPLLSLLTQMITGRGKPSAVQFKEIGAEFICCTVLTGGMTILVATVFKKNFSKQFVMTIVPKAWQK